MKKPQQTPAQAATPYIDALLGYRTKAIVPFHTPGHKLGKGAPAIMREVFGDGAAGRRRGHGRRRRRHARVDRPGARRRRPGRRGLGRRALLLSGQRLDQRHPRPAAHPGRTGRRRHPAAQRPQVGAGRPHLLGRRAALRRAHDRSRLGHPPERARRARRRRDRGPPRSQGACSSSRPTATASAPRSTRSPARCTAPACRSWSTRPGALTCASAAACRSTPCRPAPTPWWPARTS